MVSEVLHTEGEKRDFTIILVYLLLTSTVSDVKFKNLLQPRAVDAEGAFDARVETAALQAVSKDGLRADESNLPTPVNTIMSWLTSFSFFRPASNNLFTYFLQDQRSNGNNRRDDFDLSLLNNIPLPHAAEPRPTGDEDGGMDLDALRMDGMSLFDFQEDFAAGLSLGAGVQPEVNGQVLAYARFNSFDQFLEFNSAEADWKQEHAQSPNCICEDGKLVAFMDPLPAESLQNGEDSFLLDELPPKLDLAAGCAIGIPCATQQNASAAAAALLDDDEYVRLLTELGQTNAVEYEGLEQYAYAEAQHAAEVKRQIEVKQETTWNDSPAVAERHSTSSDHDYAALNDEQQTYWPVTQMDQSAFDGATPSAPQVSDDESGVHTDDMLDFDPEQNAFGGFAQSPIQPAFVQPQMYNTPTESPSLPELEDLEECSEEIDEQSAYTMPKASYRRKRDSSEAAGSSWHESEYAEAEVEAEVDETEGEDAQSMTMSSATYSSANLPFSDHEIIHSSWARFEAMLRDRRLSASDLQIMKDIRRRGKNKIAAMNCRRRKQSRVDSLRDERVELNRENEQLEAELIRLREQAKVYDARLERALRMLHEPEDARARV